ncbi:hypothetical protein PVAND_017194 [Polypedilum vanderplanki]|uniref:Secreted protein n=1 Tax=Polypedilum vanderplanki TaxID=319348 RepID=A0A9J6BHX4_POLVA|nr:hypothetical protein PVAND_017194 [Polypedilum vanderplanki]
MFKILFLFAVIGAVAPQRSAFVDYILDLQYAVGFIHDYIQDTTWQSRYDMSDELTVTIEGAVTEITTGLTNFLTIRNRIENYVTEHRNTTSNQACVDEAVAGWSNLQTSVGATISACGTQHLETIHGNVQGYHDFVNSHRNVKFDAQNIVLSTLTTVNTMTNFPELTPAVEQGINEAYDFYEEEVHPGIQSRLNEFGNLRTGIPTQVHDCVAGALNNFDSDAMLMLQAVRAC